MKKISLFIICLVLLVFGASTTSARQLLSRRHDGQGVDNTMVASFIERLGKKRKGKPCGFVLKVDPESGEVEQTEIPSKGLVNDIIIEARYTTESLMLPVLRAMNPDPNM